jgi:hypothetical protein
MAEVASTSSDNVRLWILKGRSGSHGRPFFERLTEEYFSLGFTDMFVEVLQSSTPPSPMRSGSKCLLFIKLFDVSQQELYYIGHRYASKQATLTEILSHFTKQLVIKDSNQKINFYFEFPFEADAARIDSPQMKLGDCLRTVRLSPDENGHIVVIEYRDGKSTPTDSSSTLKRANNLEEYYRLLMGHADVLFMDRSLLMQSLVNNQVVPTEGSLVNNGNSCAPLKLEDSITATPRISQHPCLSNGFVGSATELAQRYHAFFLPKLSVKAEYWSIVGAIVTQLRKQFPDIRLPSGAPVEADHIQLFLVSMNAETPVPSEEEYTLHHLLKSHESNQFTYGRLTTLSLDDRNPPPLCFGKHQLRTFQHRLFYQILDNPISDVEAIRALRIWYVPPTIQEEVEVSISVSIHASVDVLLEKVLQRLKVMFSDNKTSPTSQPQGQSQQVLPALQDLRLWEVYDHRLLHEHPPRTLVSQVISNLTKASTSRYLRVDVRPPDEKEVGGNDMVLPVAHFYKDTLHTHGLPFTLRVTDNEHISDVIERIRIRLHVPQKEIAKWRFVLVVDNQIISVLPTETINVAYLQQQVSESNTRSVWSSHRGVWIGLDHPQVLKREEKAIKIHN